MGGGVDLRVHADVLKAHLPADHGAAPIVTQHVKPAAGHQAHNGGLPFRELRQGGDAAVKVRHKAVHFLLQSKERGNGVGVLPHGFHHALFRIGRKVHHGGDFGEGVIGACQPPADENHVRLAGHDCFQVRLFDGSQVGNVLVDVALEVVQAGAGGAHHTVAYAQGV